MQKKFITLWPTWKIICGAFQSCYDTINIMEWIFIINVYCKMRSVYYRLRSIYHSFTGTDKRIWLHNWLWAIIKRRAFSTRLEVLILNYKFSVLRVVYKFVRSYRAAHKILTMDRKCWKWTLHHVMCLLHCFLRYIFELYENTDISFHNIELSS